MTDMTLHRLYIKNLMLIEALKFYAEPKNWITASDTERSEMSEDHGLFARQTLELLENIQESEDKEQTGAGTKS